MGLSMSGTRHIPDRCFLLRSCALCRNVTATDLVFSLICCVTLLHLADISLSHHIRFSAFPRLSSSVLHRDDSTFLMDVLFSSRSISRLWLCVIDLAFITFVLLTCSRLCSNLLALRSVRQHFLARGKQWTLCLKLLQLQNRYHWNCFWFDTRKESKKSQKTPFF